MKGRAIIAVLGFGAVFLLIITVVSSIGYWTNNNSPFSLLATPHQSQFLKTFTWEEEQEVSNAMRPPQECVRIEGIAAGASLQILVDLNDDGVINAEDSAERAKGVKEIVRVNDAISNGRSRCFDRTPHLDDDLQLLVVQLPQSTNDTDEITFNISSSDAAVYETDWISAESEVIAPRSVASFPYRDVENERIFIWLLIRKPVENMAIEVDMKRDDLQIARDNLSLKIVGKLGDPSYFLAARDYLMERSRVHADLPTLFIDEAQCQSVDNDGTFETFLVVVMRHELTEMDVLETYYANNDSVKGRIKNVFDVLDRFPDEDVVINGNFFYIESDKENHGKRALGALVHNHELSQASGWHAWQVSYEEARIHTKPDWQFKSYCLTQRDPGPGNIALIEEPLNLKEPFVPPGSGAEKYPYMAMGGLHQVHNFINNPGFPKACMGFAEVPEMQGSGTHRLMWFAASLDDRSKSTSYYGGEAFRQALRDSGLTIEEGDPQNGVGPGRCDLVYFDSANSVTLAYRIDGIYETPTAGGRHMPGANNTLCNNYLALKIKNQP